MASLSSSVSCLQADIGVSHSFDSSPVVNILEWIIRSEATPAFGLGCMLNLLHTYLWVGKTQLLEQLADPSIL